MSLRDILGHPFHPHVSGFPEKDSGQAHPPKDLRVGGGPLVLSSFLTPRPGHLNNQRQELEATGMFS